MLHFYIVVVVVVVVLALLLKCLVSPEQSVYVISLISGLLVVCT